MKSISVLLADDHAIIRYGIRMFLSTADDITIVGEASSGEECIELCERYQPDVCLLDIGLPDMDGIQAAKAIDKLNSDIKILFLSMHLDQRILEEVLNTNVNGYLLKNNPKQNILEGIRSVASGNHIYSKSVSKILNRSIHNSGSRRSSETIENITDREREVLNLVVEGYPSSQIAEKLYISRRTVDTHRSNLMKKLDIHNTASLVRYALQHDLVDKSAEK